MALELVAGPATVWQIITASLAGRVAARLCEARPILKTEITKALAMREAIKKAGWWN